jgi:hypothetical protein
LWTTQGDASGYKEEAVLRPGAAWVTGTAYRLSVDSAEIL